MLISCIVNNKRMYRSYQTFKNEGSFVRIGRIAIKSIHNHESNFDLMNFMMSLLCGPNPESYEAYGNTSFGNRCCCV